MRTRASLVAWSLAVLLAGCAGGPAVPRDDEPTLKTLAGREAALPADAGIASSERQAIDAYRKFLDGAPRAPQRAEALRRIADLEMDVAEGGADKPDYRAAIARYEDYLRAYPDDPGNDRVLYQLARGQELLGGPDVALATLDRLLRAHPRSAYADEVQFRRGELLFALRQYAQAERAYTSVLAGDNALRERALYMQGWSRFKQGRLGEALASFFGVLDALLAGPRGAAGADGVDALARGDRELLEDSLRVTSIALASLQGAASIAPFVDTPARRDYAFRVYRALGELYLKQDRPKDAADAFAAYAREQPLQAQAPVMQARAIEIVERAGFAALALEAKQSYVERYGATSEFRRANPEGWSRARPLVRAHLAELARHYHASAQKTKQAADVDAAARWYREGIAAAADDEASAAASHFMLGELLFEAGRFDAAALEYEKTAYGYARHARSADAGYAALLASGKALEAQDSGAKARRALADAELRFAREFPADARAAAVLADAAEKLYAQGDAERAVGAAEQLLARDPPAAPGERRVAHTVIAHAAFERGDFARAESAYAQALALAPASDAGRADLVERQAAAIYKQGEQARDAGALRDAAAQFARVASVAPPTSPVRASAQYDAAAALIAAKDWGAAAQALEDFRRRFPGHALQDAASAKLAAVYLEQGAWAKAAGEFDRVASASRDPQLARQALWQSAELQEKAGDRAAAARAYERYVREHAQPLEPAVEARSRLARIARADGQRTRELALLGDVIAADRNGGAARTERTRTLAAQAALEVAQPLRAEFDRVALVEPLARSLKAKKARLEQALAGYAAASDYGVAAVTTAATFHSASLYRDFARALLASERPKRLSKLEREQYDVLLEEQAFPFEEKAAALHELNARRAASGLYDEWVQRSYAALGELKPVRYGKVERVEGAFDAMR